MKTLKRIAAALLICLAIVSMTADMATARESNHAHESILAEINELEQVLKLALIAGDYRLANALDADIGDLEMLLRLAGGGPGNITNTDLGSGRLRVGLQTVGSGR